MLSIPHLIVIFIVALVVFGPEKIPELARNLGKVMAEFRRVTGDLRSTFEGHLRDLEREADQRRIAAVPAPQPAAAATASSAENPNPENSSAAPGTVPANPPNAAASAAPAVHEVPPSPGMTEFTRDPSDPMHDPYLKHMDFTPPDAGGEPAHPQPEPKPERVTDGDGRA